MKVTATKKGWYGEELIEEGKEFECKEKQPASWMEKVTKTKTAKKAVKVEMPSEPESDE
jgi:hypothetical protein